MKDVSYYLELQAEYENAKEKTIFLRDISDDDLVYLLKSKGYDLYSGRIQYNEETGLFDVLKTDSRYSIFFLEDVKFLIKNGELRISFGVSRLSFIATGLFLTSLKGFPTEVQGDFLCDKNYLTNLVGAPSKVSRHFSCRDNELTSLKGCPKEIFGQFNCSGNHLTSLEGGPLLVGRSYSCEENRLQTLKGCARKVGAFYCSFNELKSLEGSPSPVEETFESRHDEESWKRVKERNN